MLCVATSIQGAEWRSLRHKLTPTFTSGRMRAMFPLIRACAEELDGVLAAEAERGMPIEMFELLARFTTDIIGTCAFGIQVRYNTRPANKGVSCTIVHGRYAFAPHALS